MGMKCYRLPLLSLCIWGWVDSSLLCHLIYPPTVYGQCTYYSRVREGGAEILTQIIAMATL